MEGHPSSTVCEFTSNTSIVREMHKDGNLPFGHQTKVILPAMKMHNVREKMSVSFALETNVN
jgi:hypothetical protein